MSFDRNQFPKSFSSSKFKKSKRPPRSHQQQNYHNPAVESIFNNIFEFNKRDEEWILPDSSQIFTTDSWDIPILQNLKSDLNFQKSRLNDYSIENWSIHTKKRNVAGDVRWKMRSTVNPEFLTQAWTKFYECAYTFDIVSDNAKQRQSFNSVHLCEAPGAFIASLNHYLKLHHRDLQWNWMASTLNPYYESNSPAGMICDDRFMLYTLDCWDFGLDYSGNLMDWKNSQHLVAKAKTMEKIDLITADGSINCTFQPDEQETIVAPLHFCEVFTALQILSEGGSIIIKLFTIFEHATINLVYLLAVSFKSISIFKPVTSKHGNSEVYAICQGYCGLSLIHEFIGIIQNVYGSNDVVSKAMFPLECLPYKFLCQIKSCAMFFYNIQVATIDDNISTYENSHLRREISLKKFRFAVACAFVDNYRLMPIDINDKILKGMTQEYDHPHPNPTSHTGSFNERLQAVKLTDQEEITNLYEEMLSLDSSLISIADPDIDWINCKNLKKVDLTYTFGKPVDKVRSSKFVLNSILILFNKTQKLFLNHSNSKMLSIETEDKLSENEICIIFQPRNHLQRLDDWEMSSIIIIHEKLKTLMNGDSLKLENYDLLKQFNVGILYLMALNSFEDIGFIKNSGVYLKGFKNQSIILNILETIISAHSRVSLEELDICDERVILGVVPIQILGQGNFYKNVLCYNNNELFSSLKQMFSVISV